MPTYEYECDSCGISFERLQRISDEPIRACPECGGQVRRLISTGGGLVFKGPGFYATDYKSGARGAPKAGSADAGASVKNGTSGEAKGEGSKGSTGGGGNDDS
jgi:putative FmdB family regulatory protein